MILEYKLDTVSANWDSLNNKWNVRQKKRYRWCNHDMTPLSKWFYDFGEAIDWIKYERTN